jgi:hypothetical protein
MRLIGSVKKNPLTIYHFRTHTDVPTQYIFWLFRKKEEVCLESQWRYHL